MLEPLLDAADVVAEEASALGERASEIFSSVNVATDGDGAHSGEEPTPISKEPLGYWWHIS